MDACVRCEESRKECLLVQGLSLDREASQHGDRIPAPQDERFEVLLQALGATPFAPRAIEFGVLSLKHLRDKAPSA